MRIVHLGPGPFFRAHAAWYTEHAGDGASTASEDRWGIAAACSAGAGPLEALGPQDGLYSLRITPDRPEEGAEGDLEVVQAVSLVLGPADRLEIATRPEVAVVTVTVTEAGYDGPAMRALAGALRRRVESGAGPLACCSLDNLPDNGTVLASAIERSWPGLAGAGDLVTFPSSVVDRVTPRPSGTDRAEARESLGGLVDEAATVTERFAEWVVEDDFPGGRPAWERAGATLVAPGTGAITRYERRKLRLLNGGHTALAALGLPRGHRSVAEAYGDPAVRAMLEEVWREAQAVIGDEQEYLERTRSRFAASAYPLAQIAENAPAKVAVRLAPTVADAASRGGRAAATASVIRAALDN